jgi:SAM-dependent methyltransferase
MLQQLKRAAKANGAVTGAVRSTYPALSWITNRRAVWSRYAPYLTQMEFDDVRLTGHGNEPEAHLRRTKRLIDIKQSDTLVIGVGSGDELSLWERAHPRSLTATDFLAQPRRWHCHDRVRFAQADVRSLPFADHSFDLVASTALFEHVNGVERAAREMARVTRPGGLVFANFGPLYHTYGGAHFEGAYEHLWMSDEQLERYLEARAIPSEVDDGLLWLRSGMFSRLRYTDYAEIFKRYYAIEHMTIAVSGPAMRYRRAHAAEWRALTQRFDEADLLTFSMTVWMRPKVPSARVIDLAAARTDAAAQRFEERATLLQRRCA